MTPWMVILVGVALIQHVVFPHITFFGAHPNLMLVVVMAWGVLRGNRDGLIWALVGGLLLDLFSLAPIGTATLPLLIVMFLVGLLEFTAFRVVLWLPIAAALVATPLYQLLSLTVLKSLGWNTGWGRTFELMLPLAILNALLMFFVFPLMRRVSGWAGEKGIEWRRWET
jgi:rod shape-determining protein MreD